MSQPVVKNTQNQSDSLNYKPKLDEAASRVKTPPQEEPSSGIIDKVSQYIPAVGNMLGGRDKEPERQSAPTRENVSGPPERPEHDAQIEEFIKDQHRSKQVVGIEEPTQT